MTKTTKEEFLRRFEESNSTFELLSDFDGWGKKLEVVCKKRGHKCVRLPRTLLNSNVCDTCRRIDNTRSLEEIQSIVGDNIEIVSGYEKVTSRVRCKCRVCHNEWDALIYNLIQGSGCPQCRAVRLSELMRRDKDWFDAKLAEITSEVICIGDYTTTRAKARFKCMKCGDPFIATPHNVLQGSKCPRCSISKGEDLVLQNLIENQINYVAQKKFEGLVGVGGRKLSYDFYLPEYNLLIEFQGRGHYEPVAFANRENLSAEEQFEKQVEHDRRKREYAENNGYKLLEISYKEMDKIPEIIRAIKVA